MTKACDLTAIEARELIGNKKLSPVELSKSCLEQIEKLNSSINAVVAINHDDVLREAQKAEDYVMSGDELGILHGLPVGIKDLNLVKNLRSTSGSKLYENRVPKEDDSVVKSIRDEGAIIFCKTNTPEFGAGANTKNKVYGTTCNPFDLTKTPAGSSGGSSAALATNMMPLANGSDYGGSLRTPAGFCGVTGFRPSPGLVPATDASVALNPFSVQGPMGRTVSDTYLLLQAQISVNKNDPFSSLDALSLPDTLLGSDLSGVKMAFSSDLGCAPVDNDIKSVFLEKINTFKNHFFQSHEDHPNFLDIHNCFEVIRGFNFVASHKERFDNNRDLLEPNVIDNVERGLEFSLADVSWAHVMQTKIYKSFRHFFDNFDVLICPAAAVSPYPHEQLFVDEINGEKMPTYMRWLALSYASTMAIPCVWALPCGLDHKSMPFGIQLIAPAGRDAQLSEIAKSLEIILMSNEETKRPIPNII
jgi:Asp-tRNA(Asn)/Glu-tRNA(Gln) amidotransferase A subunit family amidase